MAGRVVDYIERPGQSSHGTRLQHTDSPKQVIFCFAQGVLWTLVLSGWRHWNRSAKFSGQGVGARIRRWWWGVNDWKVPSRMKDTKLAKNVSEVSVAFLKVRHLGTLTTCRHTDGVTVLQSRIFECGAGLSTRTRALHLSALASKSYHCGLTCEFYIIGKAIRTSRMKSPSILDHEKQ
jgi:hypothetical protein